MTEPSETTESTGQASESKEERFTRLAKKRTQAAIEKIRLLENLSSSSYGYTDEQVQKMLGALRQAVEDVERKFNKQPKMEKSPFTL